MDIVYFVMVVFVAATERRVIDSPSVFTIQWHNHGRRK
jgi:hypothetical protein